MSTRVLRWYLSLWVLIVSPFTAVSAQDLQALPNVDLVTNGTIYALARQSDGSIIFGGQFLTVNGVPRSNIGRLLADGSLDLSWNPSVNGAVFALTVDSTDSVFAGGGFTQVNGLALPYLAKLAGVGSGAPSAVWAPAPNQAVRALSVSGFTLYVGGSFTEIGGQPRAHIARLNTNANGAADSWDPSADQAVHALSVVAVSFGDDYLIAGGDFTVIGGLARAHIAKLSGTTSSADPLWNPSANSSVLALSNDGAFVYAGGYFSTIGALSRSRIAKLTLSSNGAAIASFNPGSDDAVLALNVNTSGTLYVGGSFKILGGLPRAGVARLATATGTVDASWNPGALGNVVNVLRVRSDGVVYLGGSFRQMAGQSRLSLARIDADANSTVAADVMFRGSVNAMVRQADGGVIVGGQFARANGLVRNHLLRLLPDGSLDSAWAASANDYVGHLAVDSNQRIYLAGQFTRINGLPRVGIARLDSLGGLDASWNAQSDSFVRALALAPDDSIYVGGSFSSIGGAPRNHIARLSAVDALADPLWDPSADDWVWSLAAPGNGSVYVGGTFANMGGQVRAGLAKLAESGTGLADALWNPGADSTPLVLLVSPQGAIYAGGYFSHIGGQARPAGLAKLAASGTGAVDVQWNPPLTGNVAALAMDTAGALFAAGYLYEPGSLSPRNALYKLDPVAVGTIASNWQFSADSGVSALVIDNGKAWIGGAFAITQSAPRSGLAALTLELIDPIFAGGFENTLP